MLTSNPRPIVAKSYRSADAATDPVTVAEFHDHARTLGLGQDDKIEDFLKAARIVLEDWTGRPFITQTWKLVFDTECSRGPFDDFWYTQTPTSAAYPIIYLPRIIEIPKRPLISVSSIVYYLDDDSDASTTFATSKYYVSSGEYGKIMLRTGEVWPTNLRPVDSLIVTYTCGYGATAASVPQAIRESIIEMAAHMYENREGNRASNEGGAIASNVEKAFIPAGVRTKLAAYRVPRL